MAVVRKPSSFMQKVEEDLENFFSGKQTYRERTYLIPLDLIEEENSFIIEADLPGFSVDEIDIEATFDQLVISANRIIDEEEGEVESKFIRRERLAQNLTREVHFNKPVNASEAKVNLKNGVLTIIVPIAKEAQKVKLSIN